ncbi:uncharacterized protein M421DRAFT_421674 [Didymella exigua CBS 183.55]|uniref:5'-3' DNA helicase ZGRF1-like N-terminal domain-containing protein n=1 Tax=Didymella exigua CBS 183.55 TaxID=1150837 RepID=A0A6A5RHM5_9PLEO|nr:uncharacterized protein M421DRAFT_421674 [Didymella exigua CBS 183.55]KAF1927282.1 hypothetical protein M421DRAFT_421674 [Didymella exigua CBS 183.55]
MTAPLRSTPHSQLPASQTAPVAEFRCLYTPDVRKKQKKWQDGFLKFHAFNSRVMVYDHARNFLGDTYYKDRGELHEGDELTLDKGVMVEVADAIGVTQTDLAPLFEKKPREGLPPPPAPPRRFQPPSQVARPQVAPASTTARATAKQPRHKALNTLLGTPKGPIGRSVPVKSPYEVRQEKEREKEDDFAVDRAAKRPKTAHSSTSSASLRLSSPVQEDSPAPKNSLPLWAKTSNARTARKPARPIPQGAPVITLDELDAIAHVSSDASLPSTPPRVNTTTARPPVTPAPAVRSAAVERPVLQTPRIPRGKVPVTSVKASETPQAPAPTSPPVSASNRLTNVDFAVQPTPVKEPVRRPPEQPEPPLPVEPPQSPPLIPKAKSLRLSKGIKRGTLMICQSAPPPRSREVSEARATPGEAIALKLKRKATVDGERAGKLVKTRQTSPEDALGIFNDDQEVMHGLMDQVLAVSGTPPPPPDQPILVPDSPELVPLEPRQAKPASRNARKATPLKANEAAPAKAGPPPPRVPAIAEPRKQSASKTQQARKHSPPAALVAEAVHVKSRAGSPALSAVSNSRSRTTSLSPQKSVALSTGGFQRKAKRETLQTTPAPDTPAVVSRNEIVALPPHPLRANKKGPVMTTTELAAMLQKPKKKAKVPFDPIDDGAEVAGMLPNRKFRRVRSVNDAPIPSTSEAWEKRNLPKATATCRVTTAELEPPAASPPPVVLRKESGLAALIRKTDPRTKFARTQSLTVETTMPLPQETESLVVSPVVDRDVGPWSTDAFDLFDWRPPGRGEVQTGT